MGGSFRVAVDNGWSVRRAARTDRSDRSLGFFRRVPLRRSDEHGDILVFKQTVLDTSWVDPGRSFADMHGRQRMNSSHLDDSLTFTLLITLTEKTYGCLEDGDKIQIPSYCILK